MKRHLMELPEKILIGHGVMRELGPFIKSFGFADRVLIVTGRHVKEKVGHLVQKALVEAGFKPLWFPVDDADVKVVRLTEDAALKERVSVVLGLGGGKSVDVAKLAAYETKLPSISVPTSASHDGISSPFASIKGLNKPYSLVARPPIGILADIDVIMGAPRRLLRSGCGDLVAKVTAVKDWELANKAKGEYYGKYAANLALLSASIVMEESKKVGEGGEESVRSVVEALISAGVAAGIAGSSRPCSGSEHLFSHALDLLAPGLGLHGEKAGLGAIMMAKLQGLDWERIAESLKNIGAPRRASEIGISDELVVKALLLAPTIRAERYTVLNEAKLDHDSALRLAQSVGVVSSSGSLKASPGPSRRWSRSAEASGSISVG